MFVNLPISDFSGQVVVRNCDVNNGSVTLCVFEGGSITNIYTNQVVGNKEVLYELTLSICFRAVPDCTMRIGDGTNDDVTVTFVVDEFNELRWKTHYFLVHVHTYEVCKVSKHGFERLMFPCKNCMLQGRSGLVLLRVLLAI